MIFTFKKCWRDLKRTVSVVMCLVLLSVLFVVPASAAESSQGRVAFLFNNYLDSVWQKVISPYVSVPSVGSSYPSFFSTSLTPASVMRTELANIKLSIDPDVIVNGTLGVYVSFYLSSSFEGAVTSPAISSIVDGRVYYTDGVYVPIDVGSVSVSNFPVTPIDGGSVSSGYLIKGRTDHIDSIATIDQLYLAIPQGQRNFIFNKPSGVPGEITLNVPSVSFVVGSSADTLNSLEDIADSIAAQSQIMSAMYGDIMSLLNDLYARLGDIQSVLEVSNTYFSQLIPIVNSINSNTANIYALLQTQFQLLRTLIATESDDIQGAISQQTQDLIDYLDTVFAGAVGSMPEKSDDLDTSVGNFSDAESQYQSTATQRFDELASSFNGFSGGTLSGITLASTLFSRVWDALGDYSIVYTFPLLLGLSLVLVGRLGRGSGGQSSAEKHRGDSSA